MVVIERRMHRGMHALSDELATEPTYQLPSPLLVGHQNPHHPDSPPLLPLQDMAYWPRTPDTRTATFSLAIDSTTKANGCLNFIPGSHLSKTVRPHKPVGKTREEAHAIAIEVDEQKEHIAAIEVPRGGVTVHDE